MHLPHIHWVLFPLVLAIMSNTLSLPKGSKVKGVHGQPKDGIAIQEEYVRTEIEYKLALETIENPTPWLSWRITSIW